MMGLVRIAGLGPRLGGWHIEVDPPGRTLCGLELPVDHVERAVLLSGVGCPHCQDAIAAAAAGVTRNAPGTNDDDGDGQQPLF